MADTKVILSSEEAYEVADQLALTSSEVLRFRLRNHANLSIEQKLALEKCEDQLDQLVVEFRNRGITLIGDEAAAAKAEILGATAKAQKFLDKLKKIQKGIQVIVAVVDLARAIISHDAKGVLNAAKAVRDGAKSK